MNTNLTLASARQKLVRACILLVTLASVDRVVAQQESETTKIEVWYGNRRIDNGARAGQQNSQPQPHAAAEPTVLQKSINEEIVVPPLPPAAAENARPRSSPKVMPSPPTQPLTKVSKAPAAEPASAGLSRTKSVSQRSNRVFNLTIVSLAVAFTVALISLLVLVLRRRPLVSELPAAAGRPNSGRPTTAASTQAVASPVETKGHESSDRDAELETERRLQEAQLTEKEAAERLLKEAQTREKETAERLLKVGQAREKETAERLLKEGQTREKEATEQNRLRIFNSAPDQEATWFSQTVAFGSTDNRLPNGQGRRPRRNEPPKIISYQLDNGCNDWSVFDIIQSYNAKAKIEEAA